MLEISWASRSSSELGQFCLLPDSGVGGGKWWLAAPPEASSTPGQGCGISQSLGLKATLTRWSDLGLHAPGWGIEQLSSG